MLDSLEIGAAGLVFTQGVTAPVRGHGAGRLRHDLPGAAPILARSGRAAVATVTTSIAVASADTVSAMTAITVTARTIDGPVLSRLASVRRGPSGVGAISS